MKKLSWYQIVGIAAGLGFAANFLSKKRNRFDFNGKVAFITGGSRGLGLSLAWNLLEKGASVALVARDREELERGKKILLKTFPSASILTLVADVTERSQLQSSIEECLEYFERIDLLINNAGAIVVAPFGAMEIEDFQALMKIHLYAAVNAIKMMAPYFKSRGSGRILNICSLGGKFAVPHMAAYDASKFALAGFTQGIQPELAAQNIIMTTAYPTVMRTGSPIQAVFKGDYHKEFKLFETMDNAPLLSMSADKAAKIILNAVADGKAEVILSISARIRVLLGAIFPNLMNSVTSLVVPWLPKDESKLRRTGADSTLRLRRTRQEIMYNQKPHHDAEFNMGIT